MSCILSHTYTLTRTHTHTRVRRFETLRNEPKRLELEAVAWELEELKKATDLELEEVRQALLSEHEKELALLEESMRLEITEFEKKMVSEREKRTVALAAEKRMTDEVLSQAGATFTRDGASNLVKKEAELNTEAHALEDLQQKFEDQEKEQQERMNELEKNLAAIFSDDLVSPSASGGVFENAMTRLASCSPGLARLVKRALQKNLPDLFHSAEEILKEVHMDKIRFDNDFQEAIKAHDAMMKELLAKHEQVLSDLQIESEQCTQRIMDLNGVAHAQTEVHTQLLDRHQQERMRLNDITRIDLEEWVHLEQQTRKDIEEFEKTIIAERKRRVPVSQKMVVDEENTKTKDREREGKGQVHLSLSHTHTLAHLLLS